VYKEAAGFHPALEALRGFASVAVVLFHCTLCWSVLVADDAHASFVSDLLLISLSADAPVVLFFVLSGFVLTGALARLGGLTPGSIAAYLVRRLFRIVPAAWAALIVTIAVLAIFSRWPRYLEGTDYWIAEHLGSFNLGNLVASLLFVDDPINPMYWSLHVELVGSALMPLLYAAIQKHKPGFAAVPVVVGLLLPFVPHRFGPLGHLLNIFLFSLAFGTLAFHVSSNHPRLSKRLFSFRLGISAAALLVLAHKLIGPMSAFGPVFGHTEWLAPILGKGANIDLHVQHLLEAGAGALLVGSIVTHPPRWSLLENPASRFAGRISYSLYVIHFAVIVACVVLIRTTFGTSVTAHPWLAPFLTIGLVLPLSIMAAALMYIAIEKPGMELGKRVGRMRGRTAVAAPPAA
jgi:peptidoglycan/LPS O-acetylase OafA/YrhL